MMARSPFLFQAQIEQFCSIFLVGAAAAHELLEACSGNVERAMELHLSRQAEGDASKSSLKKRAAVEAELIDDDEFSAAPAAKPNAAIAPLKKRAAESEAASPSASPSKRAKGGKKGTPVKDENQHSLASFFSKPAAAKGASTLSIASSKPIASARSPASSPASAAPTAAASSSFHTAVASHSAAAAASSSSVASTAPVAPTLMSISDNLSASASEPIDPLRPCWKPGEPVPFIFLSRIYSLMEHENGRIKMTNWLSYAFWQILSYTPADLPAALFLSSDQLAPPYQNFQLGVGGATLVRLVTEMTGASHRQLSNDHARLGDLGLIAVQYRHTQKLLFTPAPLTVSGVFKTFHAIGSDGKRDRKDALLKKMFTAARESELCYLIRISEGGLRIGAVVTTVLSALAKAFVLHQLYCDGVPEERRHEVCTWERVLKATDAVKAVKVADIPAFVLSEIPADATPPARAAAIARRIPSYIAHAIARLRRAYAELPSFHQIIPVLLKGPTVIYELQQHIQLTAGVPVKPQLGRPLTSQCTGE
jgi:hypothetical protein